MTRSTFALLLLLISDYTHAAYIDCNSYDSKTSQRARSSLAAFTLNGSPFYSPLVLNYLQLTNSGYRVLNQLSSEAGKAAR